VTPFWSHYINLNLEQIPALVISHCKIGAESIIFLSIMRDKIHH